MENLAAIIGGVILLIAAFFMFKSSKKPVSQQSNQSMESLETSATVTNRGVIQDMPVSKENSLPAVQEAVAEEPASDKQATAIEPDASPALSSSDQEVSGEESDGEAAESEVISTSPAETDEISQNQLVEEVESTGIDKAEKAEEVSENENPSPPKPKDSIFDMFTEEAIEESESSKLAAKLDNTDASDILSEARDLISQFKAKDNRR